MRTAAVVTFLCVRMFSFALVVGRYVIVVDPMVSVGFLCLSICGMSDSGRLLSRTISVIVTAQPFFGLCSVRWRLRSAVISLDREKNGCV